MSRRDARFRWLTNTPGLPTEDGLYVDSGGFPWERDEGVWAMLSSGDEIQVGTTHPIGYAPFVRLRPVAPAPHMLGEPDDTVGRNT